MGMKQWRLGSQKGHEHLECVDRDMPKPGTGEVLIRWRAASLNYRDLIVVTDPDRFTPGRVPLSDGAGEVVEVGADVTPWRAGDRVMGAFFRDWTSGRFEMRYHQAALGGTIDGVLQEYSVLPQHALVRCPESMTYEQAATLPCAGLTAWYALMVRGEFTPGQSVLLLGTGGVSMWGLLIAAAAGGRTIITSSNQEKLSRAEALGASMVVNYVQTPQWDQEVLRLTAKRGVDQILEVGGPGTLAKSLACVAAGGHIAQIGVLTGFGAANASLFPLVAKNARMSGIYVGAREAFVDFVRFLEQTQIEPPVDQVFAFEDARSAYAHLLSQNHFGKVVIRYS